MLLTLQHPNPSFVEGLQSAFRSMWNTAKLPEGQEFFLVADVDASIKNDFHIPTSYDGTPLIMPVTNYMLLWSLQMMIEELDSMPFDALHGNHQIDIDARRVQKMRILRLMGRDINITLVMEAKIDLFLMSRAQLEEKLGHPLTGSEVDGTLTLPAL